MEGRLVILMFQVRESIQDMARVANVVLLSLLLSCPGAMARKQTVRLGPMPLQNCTLDLWFSLTTGDDACTRTRDRTRTLARTTS